MTKSDHDARYMALALRLAARARGRTSPNPMVGALVVTRGRIVGTGYHRRAGGPHAEILALRTAGARARGGTLYVTLEPCRHTDKRTPPCVPSVLASGIRRVVAAMPDPNPRVSGRGFQALRRAGVEVLVGCRRAEAESLNRAYAHWVRTGRPFVTLKAAMTLDGKIATASGESRWITGEAARRSVHRLRSRVDAVMVGIATILHDDPELTVRFPRRPTRQPLRVVLDSRLRIPSTAKVLRRRTGGPTILATTRRAPQSRRAGLRAQGVDVVVLPERRGRVSLPACLRHLGGLGVTHLLIEGGSELNREALNAGLVNDLRFYVAPRLLGGSGAKPVIGGVSPSRLSYSLTVHRLRCRRIGEDLLVEGEFQS